MQPIIIRPTPKQREAARIASENTITLYGGAIRGGKTYWLILLLWSYCRMYPKSRWVVIRESFTSLERNTLVTFQALLDSGLSIDLKKFNGKTATLHNGSQLLFMSESFDQDKELNRFRGLEINGAGIDEINEIQEATFNKLIERAGSWQHSPGCPIKILATCNPTQGWVKEKFYIPWKEGLLKTRWAYIPARIYDNPHLSPEYLESLKNLPYYEYMVFVEGDWDAMPKTGGEFYKLFEHDKVVKTSTYNPDVALHFTFDFNVNPYITCCVWQVEGKTARQIEEVCLQTPRNTSKAICAELKRKFIGHTAGVFVYGDPSGLQEDTRSEKGHNDFRIIYNELIEFKPSLRVASKAPAVAMRGNFINTIFEQGYDGITLTIDPRCVNTIADYTYLKEAADGTKVKQKEKNPQTGVTFEKWGHTSDANDYFICQAFGKEFEAYQRGKQNMNVKLGRSVSRNVY